MLQRTLLGFLCLFTLANAVSIQIPLTDGPVHTTDSWKWENCGTPADFIEVNSIQVNPDPPQPGKELTVTVNGVAKQEVVEGAYANVVVKLGLIKLLSKSFDICEEARKANASIQCPIEAGAHEVVQSVALPKEIPRAKFNVLAEGYTEADEPLFCVKLIVDFMKLPGHFW